MLFFQFLLLHFYYFCFVYNCYYFIYHKRNRFFFTLCHSYIVLHSTFVHCTTQYIYTFYYTVHLYIVLHSTFDSLTSFFQSQKLKTEHETRFHEWGQAVLSIPILVLRNFFFGGFFKFFLFCFLISLNKIYTNALTQKLNFQLWVSLYHWQLLK